MKTGKKIDMWRLGLSIVMLCIASMPLLAVAGVTLPIPTGPLNANGQPATPDYYTTANWANSPPLAKFVDALPGLTSANQNLLGQYLTVGKPDTTTYPGSDYYEIELIEYRQRMHSDLPATTGPTTGSTTGTLLRGYVQVNKGTNTAVCGGVAQPACTTAHNTLNPDPVRYLGPTIVAQADRPVRIKFTNKLPIGLAGDLFVPTDVSVMGAGTGPALADGSPCNNTVEPNSCSSYTQNRSAIHLHGGKTPWISDGTPHQWIVPAGETTPYKKGVSFANVPDMPDPGDGSMTYYYTNQQSARLLFYHEHAWGITRLNPYVGVAAGYLITDKWEQDLISRQILPPFLDQIPLIIQDKTFVDATPTPHPVSGVITPKVRITDPLWNWGSSALNGGVREPVTGDLWMPHVYMPAQTLAAGFGGVNPFGRWMYGPWFYPATVVSKGPIANPYYDADCSSPFPAVYANCTTPGQPTLIPGTPNVSMGMEAFQDSAVVNGTAFPTMTVDPRTYRFRILNAANDRFWNLSFYKADGTPGNISPDPRLTANGRSNMTEVKMVPASANLAAQNNWPSTWPVDGRDGGVPDPGVCTGAEPNLVCPNLGPKFVQIGTESGFLPKPVVINPQPITYNIDPTAFWVGNVDKMGLALGPAERADVLVDFSQYAGQTLILYNDAPAAWPARVAGYDYYTGAPDMRDSGGFGAGGVYDQATGVFVVDPNNPANVPHGPLPGYAPNTRTVMQVIVRSTVTNPVYTFNKANLDKEFTAAAPVTAVNPVIPGSNPPRAKTLFERSQEPIVVGQAAYKEAYPDSYFPPNFPWEGVAQINDSALQFVTVAGEPVRIVTEPKGIHDEMGASFDPVYGRMSGNLGMQLPNPTTLNALLVLYGFSDVPTEFINNSTTVNVEVLQGTPANIPWTVTDGTQIWKISHNGVDTHPIHFHIFDVQLINRVGWDGQILLPEPNELGWKETVKISPLEDTIVAVRPRAPLLPFGIPKSLRPLNPAIPIDSTMNFNGTLTPGSDWPIPLNNNTIGSGFSSIDWKTGQAYVGTANPPYPYPNFANRGVVTNVLFDFGWEYVWHCHILSHEEMDMMRPIVLNVATTAPSAPPAGAACNSITQINLSWTDATPAATSIGNPANEIGFRIERCEGVGCSNFAQIGTALANQTSYADTTAVNGTVYSYRVIAYNATGDSVPSTSFSPQPCAASGVTLTSSFPSPHTAPVRFTAQGVGGSGIYQYRFYRDGQIVQNYSSTPFWDIPANTSPGLHVIGVDVRTNFTSNNADASGILTYTLLPVIQAAIIATPTNLSTLVAGSTQTFVWNNTGSAQYQVHIGSTLGSDNLGTYVTTSNSIVATGLPTNGTTVYVRLYTWLGPGLGFVFNDYSYTAAGSIVAAVISTPNNLSTLAGASQIFSWNNTGSAQYQVHIGSAPGTDNLGTYVTTATSINATGLPTDGTTVYVRLYTWKGPGFGFVYNDYTYTASGFVSAATMLTPSNLSSLTGTAQVFNWTNTGALQYQLHVGSTIGAADLGTFVATTNSVNVTGLPANGTTVYVRLYTWKGPVVGGFFFNDYVYVSN